MIFSRKAIAKSARQVVLAGIFFALRLGQLPEVFAQGPAGETSAPLILRSTLENLSRGFIPAGLPPALRIKSGQIVQIETFSHHGFVDDPVTFFKGYGVSPENDSAGSDRSIQKTAPAERRRHARAHGTDLHRRR
jgi:hypothetical protein